jgi:hypothetical protein
MIVMGKGISRVKTLMMGISFFVFGNSIAGDPVNQMYVKGYLSSNVQWDKRFSSPAFKNNPQLGTQFFKPGIALNVQKASGKFIELEINRLSFGRLALSSYQSDTLGNVDASPGSVYRHKVIGVRIEYGKCMNVSLNQRFRCYFSGSVQPVFQQINISPNFEGGSVQKVLNAAASFQLVPRFQYEFKSHMLLDVGFPISCFDILYAHKVNQNLTPNSAVQKSNTFNLDILPARLALRAGIAFRL